MRALVFHAPRDVRCERVADPSVVRPGDAVVRVELGAVCGSDLHVWRGDETGLDAGTVLGHEFLGEVVAAGSDVARFRAGDAVVAPFTTSCGACAPCRAGLTCRCEAGGLFGWVEGGAGLHGAQAEYVRVPLADGTLVALPDDVDREEALLCGDVLATGMFAAEAAEVAPGTTALVVGCGPVGLMAVVAAWERGAERVLAVDGVAERRELARSFGAEPLEVDAALAGVRDATGGRGVDAALEAVGSPAATRLAFEAVRAGGTIAACGVHVEPHLAFSPGDAYDKNLTYRAGRCPARRLLPEALRVVRSGRHDLASIVSHRLPLEDGPRAYALFDGKREGCTKVLLRT